jgi:hypothetical protein
MSVFVNGELAEVVEVPKNEASSKIPGGPRKAITNKDAV